MLCAKDETGRATHTLHVSEMFRAGDGTGHGTPTSGVPEMFPARDGAGRGTRRLAALAVST